MFMHYARIANAIMFCVLVFQTVLVLVSIPLVVKHARLVKKEKSDHQQDWFLARTGRISDSRWFHPEDGEDDESRRSSPERRKPRSGEELAPSV